MFSGVQSFLTGFLRGIGLHRRENINKMTDHTSRIAKTYEWRHNPLIKKLHFETKELLNFLINEKNQNNMASFPKPSSARLDALHKLLDQITLESLGIAEPLHLHMHPPFPRTDSDISFDNLPWKYGQIGIIDIHSEKDFTIAAFVLPPHTSIPLHNHPHMTVLSRVLYGSVHVKTFDYVKDNEDARNVVQCQRDETLYKNRTVFLLEDKENLHTFRAGENGTAILDIILPQYNEKEGRICTYYNLKPIRGERNMEIEMSLTPTQLSSNFHKQSSSDNLYGKVFEVNPVDEYENTSFDFDVIGVEYIGPLVSENEDNNLK